MLITVQIAEVAIFMIFILKIIDKKWENQFFSITQIQKVYTI